MDIRTRFVFFLVTVSLVTMLALVAFMYPLTYQHLRESRLQELDGLAASLEEGMEQIASGWEDRVRLIASRTQLRALLRGYNLQENPEARVRIRQILADAYNAVPAVEALAVYDAAGEFVGSAGWGTETDIPVRITEPVQPSTMVKYEGVLSPEHEELRVAYGAALTTDGTPNGELVGTLLVRLNVEPLVRLSRIREGLGATGEIIIAIRDVDGGLRVLRPFEPGVPPDWDEVELRGESDPVYLAMMGEEGPHAEGLRDSRDEEVWAAVRHLPDPDWGLVVKIDASEGKQAAEEIGKSLTEVVISLAALSILFGTFLGLRFAKPVHELAQAAERIKEGDLSVRAPAQSQDEVGLLARNFNQMAEEMEQQVTLLREFQNYFDLSLDMLCIAGHDGYFKRVNPAFERILGWSTEELLNRRFLDFVNPEDLPKTEQEMAHLAQGLPTISFENRYMCFDGSEKILAWTAHPDPESGLIYAIARDVTELRAEQRSSRDRIEYLKDRLEKAEAKQRGEP